MGGGRPGGLGAGTGRTGSGPGPDREPAGVRVPVRTRRSPPLEQAEGFCMVGLLRNYCQQARKTTALTDLLMAALKSRRAPDERPVPKQSTLPRAVVEQ